MMTGITDLLQSLAQSCDELPPPEEMEKAKARMYNIRPGVLNAVDGYQCKKCLNRGNYLEAYELNGVWTTKCVPCACNKIRKTIRSMHRSGLKNIITDYTFEKFDDSEEWQKKIKSAAIEFSENPQGWFFIGGQSGAGKTHLCTAICQKMLLDGREVKYMLWRDEVVRLKSLITEAEEYERLISGIKTAEVLYIDDLFKTGKGNDGEKQKPTGADINLAFEILNYRYCNPELVTIISSECTMTDLADIDEAVAGRIFERAKAMSIKPDRSKNHRLRSEEL